MSYDDKQLIAEIRRERRRRAFAAWCYALYPVGCAVFYATAVLALILGAAVVLAAVLTNGKGF